MASFAHSVAPLRKIKEVQFGILSPEEIVSHPVTKADASFPKRRFPPAESLFCRKD